jgi:hypothetical protein
MSFTLHVTFSGLCLFRRSPTDELLVLLPPGHQGDPHVARVGYHVRYDSTLVSPQGARFAEIPFEGRVLDLRGITSGTSLDPSFPAHLDALEVVDISDIVDEPARPSRERARVHIRHGGVCPIGVCARPRGAQFKIRWNEANGQQKEKLQRMATSVQWIIPEVQQNSLALKSTDLRGADEQTHATLTPDGNNRIRIYVFHTLPDELPSSVRPAHEKLKKGTPAPHFRHYYHLFGNPAAQPIPTFHEHRDPANSQKILRNLFFGRRFTCMVASADG